MLPPPSDRLAGCLVGLCLGDALGAPVEGHPPAEAELYAEESLRDGRAPTRGRRGHPWGQYTDDGQLARELVRSVVDVGGFDPAHYAGRIAELAGRDGIVDGGQGTLQSAERLRRGVSWRESGSPPPYAGNGAAMRVGPLGVLLRDDPDRLVRAATDQSRITHLDPRCAAGAVVIAGAVCLAQRPGPVEPDEFLDQLWRWTATVEVSVAEALVHVGHWLRLDPAEARDAARATHFDLSPTPPRWLGGISPFVTDSVCWAVHVFLRSPDDYWEAVRLAIGVGGDTDTMAAMAGGIAGARVGLAALPVEAARKLTDRGAWGYAELVALCARAPAPVGEAGADRR